MTGLHLVALRPTGSVNWEWSSSTSSPRLQVDRVWKLELIFIYYKSEVAGWSGQEIGTDLHLLQVRDRRPPIRPGNLDKTNFQKSRRVAEVFQRGFEFFTELRTFSLEKRILRTFFWKRKFFSELRTFFFGVASKGGSLFSNLRRRGGGGGSFTTIEFQRGFDRTPRTPPPTRLKRRLGSPSYTKPSLKISWSKRSVYIFEVWYILIYLDLIYWLYWRIYLCWNFT